MTRFTANERSITAYFHVECLFESLKEEMAHADVEYNTLSNVQGQLHSSWAHLDRYGEPFADRIWGAKERLERGIPCHEREEIETGLTMDSHCKVFIDSASSSLGALAEKLDEPVRVHLELIRGLEKQFSNIEEMLPDLEKAKEQAEAANERLEERPRGFVIRFREQIGHGWRSDSG